MSSVEWERARHTAERSSSVGQLNALPEAELPQHPELILAAFRDCRRHSLDLAAPLSPEDMQLQSMPDASPTKWHLAHTTWFFETFILQHHEPNFRWFDASFCVLFNSYYNGVGAQFSRPHRGLLSRPSLSRVLSYREAVNDRIEQLLTGLGAAGADRGSAVTLPAGDASTRIPCLVRLGVNHEQQHQELLLTDIKHALAQNPAWPAYVATGQGTPATAAIAAIDAGAALEVDPLTWIDLPEGLARIGHQGPGFHFDNEGPAHEAWLPGCQLASRPVSNGEWLAFMADGGYENPLLWLDEGWAWRRTNNVLCPLHWRRGEGGWSQFTLRGEQAVDPAHPVAHVSYYEAEAYARWAGARLPTEFEREAAERQAVWSTAGPDDETASVKSQGATPSDHIAVEEYVRNWEWTGSAYLPYPGFQAATGAVGEYNGKFMVNQMVLRGASAATPEGHSRVSYRNFFPAHARWQYTGMRLARGTGA
ncbi:MAG: ergothioneine biosynthesis protein EgtB [Pseudomonadota bacterium]